MGGMGKVDRKLFYGSGLGSFFKSIHKCSEKGAHGSKECFLADGLNGINEVGWKLFLFKKLGVFV